MKNLQRLIPILEWLPNYTRSRFKGDFIAGITVAIILIPQGIAYALIAGLPPIYGLYCALVPQLVYAVFGSSRQVAIGPVAKLEQLANHLQQKWLKGIAACRALYALG